MRITNNNWLELSKLVHGNKYNYSLVQYTNNSTKVKIICPIHGIFEQAFYNHIHKKQGCKECGRISNSIKNKNNKNLHVIRQQNIDNKLLAAKNFIEKANKTHNNKYDYSKTIYLGRHTKLAIVCPIHGEFIQTPNNHLRNKNPCGCPQCGIENSAKSHTYTLQDFINKSNIVHNNKYSYSLVQYTNNLDKITIVCPEHGEFIQTAQTHMGGKGCPKCANVTRNKNSITPIDKFINKANTKHHYKYDYSLVEYTAIKNKVKIICPEHGIFEQRGEDHLKGLGCNKCSNNVSIAEMDINKYINELGIDTVQSVRNIIGPYEIDIYIPNHNLAIEYCGLRWHSEKYKNRGYHLNKLKLCQEKNVKLITIFEDEWLSKTDIVKSVLKQKLGITENKLYARKCKIIKLDNATGRKFIDQNHLQGKDSASLYLGLYYEDKLVSCMSFGKPSLSGGNKKYEWSLSRFVVLQNYQVTGGFSKLLKYFINNYQPKSIQTFADLRWSEGNVYIKNGFKLTHNTAPNYWYFKDNKPEIRYHRFGFRKSLLNKKLEKFDASKTEYQNMLDNKWWRIWDCGNATYEITL